MHDAFEECAKPLEASSKPDALIPPVLIRKSVTNENLTSLADGKRYQTLKRNRSKRGLASAEYRAKWTMSGRCVKHRLLGT